MLKYTIKTIYILFSSILAIVLGFVFAGILGAFLFGSILTISIFQIRKFKKREFSITNFIVLFSLLSILGYGMMYVGGLLGSDDKVLKKLDLIKKDLKEKNYTPFWVIISQKRYQFFNSVLSNSVKKSYHLEGLAVDIYVFDINGDKIFDTSDIKIIESSNNSVEKKYPELTGALGDYFLTKNGYFTKHMIHLDIRGSKVRFSK